ncbi:hypothetical protein [Nostoc sp.]|uniref:hypothetical protein n=1 Tax=Nostoc sp. TaxID=1180 RepID=UPI002FF7671B
MALAKNHRANNCRDSDLSRLLNRIVLLLPLYLLCDRIYLTNKNYYSLKWRSQNLLLLSIVVFLSISISITAITSYKIVKGLLLDSLKEQVLLKTHQSQDDIDNWLAIRKTEIKTLANSVMVRSLC